MLGSLGGQVKSDAKARAAKRNWQKALAAQKAKRDQTLANVGSNGNYKDCEKKQLT